MLDLNVEPSFIDEDDSASNGVSNHEETLFSLMLCSANGRETARENTAPNILLDLNVIPSSNNYDGLFVDDTAMEANCEGNEHPTDSHNDTHIHEELNDQWFVDEEVNDQWLNEDMDVHGTDRVHNPDQSVIEGTSRERKFLTNEELESIARYLKHASNGWRLKRGMINNVASMFNTSRSTIDRIWYQIRNTGDSSHKKTKNCGRKRIQLDTRRIRDTPLSQRTTLRSLSCALNISKTSLIRFQKDGLIRRHSNAIKPLMRDDNMIARMKFCLSMLDESSIPHAPRFKSMHNIVHIDEKWFYMTKKSVNYYLLPDEDEPHRTCNNKNFIPKVMFLVAVARPRFDSEGKEIFSGKIGVFPLVTQEPAKRSSANRPAGTLVTKPITSVNKKVSKFFLIQHVLPAIKQNWPREHIGETIFIQQDNAPCHVDENDEEFCRAAREDGFDIRLYSQPPNSPDLNVLDLGFFNAIQSLQHKETPKTIDDLVGAVVKAFHDFSSIQSNKIFLTLQSCMESIMKHKGSIKYKIPHIKKQIMERAGILPAQMECDVSVVQGALDYLREVGASS